jgi:hypothetical protein
VGIWSITDVGVMNATILIAPWQAGHARGSTSKICWSSAAEWPSPTGGWRRLVRVGARGLERVAGPRQRVPPYSACHGGGWHTSHRNVS